MDGRESLTLRNGYFLPDYWSFPHTLGYSTRTIPQGALARPRFCLEYFADFKTRETEVNIVSIDISMLETRFSEIGRDLFLSGAITSHGGNLSVSDGERIWITRTGSMLGRLREGDVIETSWEPSDTDANCSSELVVHREIHHAMMRRCETRNEEFGTRAIVHAHTAHTTLRSMYHDEICSVDSECKLLLPEPVKVVRPQYSIGSPEGAKMLADIVEAGGSIGVIGGHGPFAVGKTLESALQLISSLEHSCKLADMMEQKEMLQLLREIRG